MAIVSISKTVKLTALVLLVLISILTVQLFLSNSILESTDYIQCMAICIIIITHILMR